MRNVTDRIRNPFGMAPDCDRYVPGYGDANADFHVIGDHPGVHGGVDEGIPFTGEPWSGAFLAALAEAGLLESAAGVVDETDLDPDRADREPLVPGKTFLSYLHMCVPEGPGDAATDAAGRTDGSTAGDAATDADAADRTGGPTPSAAPTDADYADMERFFDAELRAIAAHVLLPVGARATDHVLRTYTARARRTDLDMDALHGEELLGSGWLVVPIKDPAEWVDGDADRLVAGLRELRSTDFRRESDLGRFIAGSDPYLVR